MIKTYGNLIKKYAPEHPNASLKMIDIGLHLESFRTKHLADSRIPKAYQELNSLAVDSILHALEHPETTAWTNLFCPVELLQCFGLNCLSAEALSSFLSGFTCEDFFIDHAESAGIASTLCSYHKCFVGGVLSGVLPDAAMAVTTSTVCDANFNTFRLVNKAHSVPTFFIDVPAQDTPESIAYVTGQLKDLISFLSQQTGKKYDEDHLSEILHRENESKALYQSFLADKASRYYPSTLTLQMYELFASHLNIGSEETLHYYRSLADEIKTAPAYDGKRIFWVHLLPFYQSVLKEYLNLSDRYQIQGFEMNMDYMEPLDESHPLEALATKMIRNLYNRPFEEKINFVKETASSLHADGIIHFCHWGCKQSIGGSILLKDALKDAGFPVLLLDGDGIDRRNGHDGQTRTRLEAFLELMQRDLEVK